MIPPMQLEDLSTEQSFTGNEDVPMSEIFSRGWTIYFNKSTFWELRGSAGIFSETWPKKQQWLLYSNYMVFICISGWGLRELHPLLKYKNCCKPQSKCTVLFQFFWKLNTDMRTSEPDLRQWHAHEATKVNYLIINSSYTRKFNPF